MHVGSRMVLEALVSDENPVEQHFEMQSDDGVVIAHFDSRRISLRQCQICSAFLPEAGPPQCLMH